MNINEGFKRLSLVIRIIGAVSSISLFLLLNDKSELTPYLICAAIYLIFHAIAWIIEGFTKK